MITVGTKGNKTTNDYGQVFKDKFMKGTVFSLSSIVNSRYLSHLKIDDVMNWKLIHLSGDKAIFYSGSEIRGFAGQGSTPKEKVVYIMDGYNISHYDIYEYEVDGMKYALPIIDIHGCQRKPYIWHTNIVYNFEKDKFAEIPFRNYTA